ncbi:MAG: sugar ABC transporter permease [Oscillospiraceae bacterium]|nr:sugar ABC transporter permease [Oscillospiraceae bacterium]
MGKGSSAIRPKSAILFFYMLPGTFLFVALAIVPVAMAIFYSLFNWSGGPNMKFIGLGNYALLINDRIFLQALGNNLLLAVCCVIFQVGTAFVISALLCSKILKLQAFHRFSIFLPVILAPVVVAFLWRIIYNMDYGLLNYFLRSIGLESWIKPWLDDVSIVMASVTVPIVWQWIGLYVIIFTTAMKSIPEEIFESASLDGANGIKKAFYITYPMILDTLKISVILAVSGCMKIFEHVYILTSGGPGTASMVMAMYAYRTSFIGQRMGYGSTISVGILVISLSLVLFSNLLVEGRKKKYE